MDVETAAGITGAGVTTIDGDGRFALLASPDPDGPPRNRNTNPNGSAPRPLPGMTSTSIANRS
jgi:hypothetical protein